MARQYDVSQQDPDIQVTDADLSGSRRLVLTHFVRDGILLDKDECDRTLMHVARLWGFRVRLVEVDNMTGAKLREHATRVVAQALRKDATAGISTDELATALSVLDRVRDNLTRIDREDRGEPSPQS